MRPVTPFMTTLTTSLGSLPMMNTLNEVFWAAQPGAGRRRADRSAPLNVPVHPERARGSCPARLLQAGSGIIGGCHCSRLRVMSRR
jgi:hypothetical protein